MLQLILTLSMMAVSYKNNLCGIRTKACLLLYMPFAQTLINDFLSYKEMWSIKRFVATRHLTKCCHNECFISDYFMYTYFGL